jgi:hypothetical protein
VSSSGIRCSAFAGWAGDAHDALQRMRRPNDTHAHYFLLRAPVRWGTLGHVGSPHPRRPRRPLFAP